MRRRETGRAAVGLTLQPDTGYLTLLDGVLRSALVDYFEVAPEQTWRVTAGDGDGQEMVLVENGYFEAFLRLGQEANKWFVAHGVGLSVGGSHPRDRGRQRVWNQRLALDQARFGYRWYSDHLGVSAPAGRALMLPLPVAMSRENVERMGRRLSTLRRTFPLVALENTAHYFLFGEPLDEPRFVNQVLSAGEARLVLDLHNVYTMAENMGFDARDYLSRLDLWRVLEIHVSGGSYSDGSWLPTGQVLRLDSHCSRVPEGVWELLNWVRPRCGALQGITLERMEGTVGQGDVAVIQAELTRIREAI